MAGTTLSAVDNILKEFYLDTVPDALNNKVELLKMFQAGPVVTSGGREVLYPFHTGRNIGTGAIGEMGNIPTAGNQRYQDWKIPFKYNYISVQFTAQSVEQAKTSKGAFVNVFDTEIKKATEDQAVYLNRQLWGFGRGDLAQVSTSGTTAVVALKNPGGIVGTVNTTRFLAVGQKVAGITLGTPNVLAWTGTIVSLDNANSTMTLSGAVTSTAGDIIVSTSVTGADATFADTGFNNEVMGMSGMVDDGTYVSTYHNIDRSTVPQAKSWLKTVSGALTLADLQYIADAVEEGGSGKVNVFWGHQTARQQYLALLTAYRRYNDKYGLDKSDGGFKGYGANITYADTEFKTDRFAPYSAIFALDKSSFKEFSINKKWADETGSIMKPVPGKDAYYGMYRFFNNYHCELPNSNGIVKGFTISTPTYVPYM